MTNFHRLYGLALEDVCIGSRYTSETEVNLSRRQQFLDVAIVEKDPSGPLPSPLPDGLDNLARHNLITYKSIHEALDDWAVQELVGHYVNYRKQLAEQGNKKLLSKTDFRLYAVATRYPENLAKDIKLNRISQGVYEVECLRLTIRVLVLSRMPDSEENALWALFSGNAEKVKSGLASYQWHNPDIGRMVIRDLNELYYQEGIEMAYTHEDYLRDKRAELIGSMTPEERLKGLSPEEVVKFLPPAELLKALPPEAIKAWLAGREMETRQ